jgi:hypothetical protein
MPCQQSMHGVDPPEDLVQGERDNAMLKAPAAGQIARVRQRLYLVENVVPPERAGESTLVRLSCVDDDAQGQPLEVLWEREIDREIITGEAWESIAKRGFDRPKLFAAYLNTLRWNCVTSTNPRLFQSPFRAGIRLDTYQLEPLRKALRLPRVNLFIADDVGLGKTIEAGLIARELLLRKKAREIIVSCPPSMLYPRSSAIISSTPSAPKIASWWPSFARPRQSRKSLAAWHR